MKTGHKEDGLKELVKKEIQDAIKNAFTELKLEMKQEEMNEMEKIRKYLR